MTRVLFVTIVMLAASFRITNLDLIEFKADEGINLFLATRPFFGHPLPPGGTASSVGILNPPLFNYLLFPFLVISKDPRVLSLFIGVLNSLAVGFFYVLIRRYYGNLTAFLAAVLLSFSPWAILYSRKIWPQDLLLPFYILFLFSIHKIVLEKKVIYWITATISVLFLVQMHQSSALFFLLFFLFLFRQKISLSKKYIVLGFILATFPLIPYFLYELKHGCPDCAILLGINEKLSVKRSLEIFMRPLQILNQGNFAFILGDDMLAFAKQFPTIFLGRSLFYIEYLLIPFSIFLFWRDNKKLRFLPYTAVTLPLLYFILRFEPFMHYFIPLMPLLFLFLGFLFAKIIKSEIPLLKYAFSVIFLALILVSISFNYAFFQTVKSQKTIKGDYGSTYAVTQEIAQKTYSKYKGSKEHEEIILTSYVPKYLIHGDLPVARMIYDHNRTKSNLSLLNERLHANPQDPRVQNELLAYYTFFPPTKSTISFLRNKQKEFPEYRLIYEEAYNAYLKHQDKKSYHSSFGFFIEYPSRWDLQENTKRKEITIKSGPYIFSLRVISPEEKVAQIKEDDSRLVKLYNAYILIEYSIDPSKKYAVTNKETIETTKLMDQISESIGE